MSPAEPGLLLRDLGSDGRTRKGRRGRMDQRQPVCRRASGVVRAFDARSGQLAWAWDVGIISGSVTASRPPARSYGSGTPNSWAPMSADESAGLVFVPTGNATPDFVASAPFARAATASDRQVVAIDAETGISRWSFRDRASRCVGLRRRLAADALRPADRRPLSPGADSANQDGSTLPARSEGRKSSRASRGASSSTTRSSSGRAAVANATFSAGMPSLAGPTVARIADVGVTPFDQLWCRIHFASCDTTGNSHRRVSRGR